jgi:uroporphyrinogen decarboxylase
MNKTERVRAVLAGRGPDHPPVSFWYHFGPQRVSGKPAVDAHLAHLEKFDLDFLKVMNDNGYPRDTEVVENARDMGELRVHQPNTPQFADQLGVIQGLAKQLKGQVLMTTTIFNPWAVLRSLVEVPKARHGPPVMSPVQDSRDDRLSELLRADRKAVGQALHTIGQSLAGFARACIEAGADGIFLSVRDDWVDTDRNGPGTYDELVAPTDRMILEAASAGRFNMLHACGKALNFDRFANYPNVQVINWADRAAGPSIAQAKDRVKAAIAAGVDNLTTLATGTPDDVRAEVRDALRQAGDRPILVTPGCTYDPDAVPEANLRAMVEAVRAA